MGKNKKKKSQMFKNFLAFKASQDSVCKWPNTGAASTFQTPHSDQEKLTELVDDNSPSVDGNQPGASGSGTNSNTSQQGKWTALKPAEDTSKIQVNVKKGNVRHNLIVVQKQPAPNTKPEVAASSRPEAAPDKMLSWPAGIPRSFLMKPAETPAQTKPTTGAMWVPNKIPAPTPVSPPQQANVGSGWPKPKVASNKPASQGWLPNTPTYSGSGQNANVPQGRNSPIFKEEPLSVETHMNPEPPQAYSPSDVYSTMQNEDETTDEEAELETPKPGSKRLSAFKRLGPPAVEPKTPKLTVNLLLKQDVRAVVDETDDCPTHLKPELTTSTDEIVVKYIDSWPWKKPITVVRTATYRHSKSVMILEQEYMEEIYVKASRYVQIVVTGYPRTWTKEDVLDAVLDSVMGNSFIPCFIEFSKVHCRFLVLKCRNALLAIHKYGFVITKSDVELIVSISIINLDVQHLDFMPRLVLRQIMRNRKKDDELDLSHFTTNSDISHFVYFPLYRRANQIELLEIQSAVEWSSLVKLDLSHNRISSLSGFDIKNSMPKLRHLNLSHNNIESVMALLPLRNLSLKSIHLEGNPLCTDYTEEEHYLKVLNMLFSELQEIDGVSVKQLKNLLDSKRNYCPIEAKPIADKLLEVMFPLLDASQEQRFLIQEMYSPDAVMTISFMYKLRYSPIYRDYSNLFSRARVLDEGDMDSIVGASNIAKIITRWPDLLHDPATFTVDVLFHSDTTTILRIGGIVKITAESLAEEEHLLSFTRTLVLYSKDGCQYKITNEMVYWDRPDKSYAETAFKMTMVKPKNLISRLDVPPDEELKEKLVEVFMKITDLDKKASERCLEAKDWQIKNALEYFSKLLKLNNLDPIMKDNIKSKVE